ncbi:hypothetical protein ACS0TY_003106 [Phlomoides rotata]
MLILSLNARGTNSCRKRKLIKDLIRDTKADIVCLQETKWEIVNNSYCEALWPDKDFGWTYCGSNGASGGLITIWRSSVFTLLDHWSTNGALAIKGLWNEKKVSINLINIYASCKSKKQQVLWDEIHEWISKQPEAFWCVCGDFNTTLYQAERNGKGRFNDEKRRRQFSKFIVECDLIDLPLLRRKFTWYKDKGGSCSRIDRFLLSTSWSNRWTNVKQSGLTRSIYDHAPILLEVFEKENWGPISFRIVNWWLDQEDFRQLVEKAWKDTVVEGWGGYVLKEKLKNLKLEIKAWKAKNSTTFTKEIEDIERQLTEYDIKLENDVWDVTDCENRRALQLNLEELRIKRDRLVAQKSRAKWLSEGEANTSFFHDMINRNNRRSELKSVKINNSWFEGGNQVKEGIF